MFNKAVKLIPGLMFVLIFLASNTLHAQSFGKNKVQYRDFNWKYLQSKHFDIYYYENQLDIAEFVADVAETSYVELNRDFRHQIQKRIPILVYNGHNDFVQTNVTYSLIEEGVGGFTEIFKDRVVIPFTGDYKDFRHVIHHELTHAVMFQVFYGGGVGSMVTGMARFQMPLWLAEGLAEYESLGWDTESDMYMRDATLNGYAPPIEYMSGFMVYKGGQSVFNYLGEKYGGPKVGEILNKIRLHRNVEEGLKQTIGIGVEELSKRWQKYLRKTYWPDIQNRDEPEDVAKRLTDHTKKKHFLNNAPSLSPKGDKMVYLTDRSDYMDIYLMSTLDKKNRGKLVKGQRSDLFEELHWSRPGISWSPDAKKIVFSAKSGSQDALYILDVKKRKILESHYFEMNGLFAPAWSPGGEEIAFVGLKEGQSDLYLFSLTTGEVTKLTDDVFSDRDPVWSPDGRRIAFISDRQDYLTPENDGFSMQNFDYSKVDVYVIDVASRQMVRLTRSRENERSPAFSPDGNKLAFISDQNGIFNIHILDLKSGLQYPITNLVTGVSQLTWARGMDRIAFSAFYNGGYDIFMINNPLDIKPGDVVLEKTAYIKKLEENDLIVYEDDSINKEIQSTGGGGFKNFIFDRNFREHTEIQNEEPGKKSEFLDSTDYKMEDGSYKTHKYKLKFTPDMITGGAGYSQFFGIQGSSTLVLSDILGNHQISIYTDLFYNLKNSNFQFGYFFLPKRTDMGISIFHYSYLFYSYLSSGNYYVPIYYRDRNYGATFYLSRPFNKFARINLGLTGLGLDRDLIALDPYGFTDEYYHELGNLYKRRVALGSLGFTTDTVLWGTTGPVNGGRSNFALNYSPRVDRENGLSFWTFRGDWRRYFRIGKDYTFVLRAAGGISGGDNPQRFLLGGMSNWINYSYRNIPEEYFNSDLFYFSTFETPLRGTGYYEMIGTRFVLTNLEFRFPLIRYLIMGWPLPFGFQNIRGAIFTDIGSAWEKDSGWTPFVAGSFGIPKLKDMMAGYGIGARLNIGFLLLRYDAAWSTDFYSSSKKPVHYISLGAEF